MALINVTPVMAETCEQLFTTFDRAGEIVKTESQKTGISDTYKAASLSGEMVLRQILDQHCAVTDREKVQQILDTMHAVNKLLNKN